MTERGKLTTKVVKSAEPRDGKTTLFADGRCLYLQVAPGKNGGVNRSWVFRYSRNGRERVMGLGSAATIGLDDRDAVDQDGAALLDPVTGRQRRIPGARTLAIQARALLATGVDPLEAKRASRPAKSPGKGKSKDQSFAAAAKGYLKEFEPGWKSPRHCEQWHQTLKDFILPVLGPLACQSIDTAAVRRVLDPIWSCKPETASRVRGRIKTVLDYAKVKQQFSWPDGNPARWRGHLEFMYKARDKRRDEKHLEAMPYGEVGQFVSELRARSDLAARALEFTILTVGRTDQVISATWDEVNLETKIWSIPGGRMKNDEPHQVPLTSEAIEISRFMESIRQGDRIFPIGGGAMLKLLREMRPGSKVTVHGFRSSFSDWAYDETDHSADAIEASMSHSQGNAVKAAYRRRHRKTNTNRGKLMEDWARFCGRIAGDNVLSLDGSLTKAAKQA
jgi:integrase